MSDQANVTQPVISPDESVKALDVLVGTWELSGDVQGQVRYEWMEGGFFLMQHVNLSRNGHHVNGLEIIGRERAFGDFKPSMEIVSRYFDSSGNTLDYVYELEDKTLTIWGGSIGSPAFFKGTFNEDNTVLDGGWNWPGGGYASTATRIE